MVSFQLRNVYVHLTLYQVIILPKLVFVDFKLYIHAYSRFASLNCYKWIFYVSLIIKFRSKYIPDHMKDIHMKFNVLKIGIYSKNYSLWSKKYKHLSENA